MTIQDLIEKAIQGGYDKKQRLTPLGILKPLEQLVLDPKFWKAVGKMEKSFYEYTDNMHHMISYLIKGGNLEDYIKTL